MNLKELSAKLGLSQTTVSRALNGYPEVSEATRKRVVAAARAANYMPSTRARSLATGRAMAIGHVIPVSTQHEMVNPVFGDFIAGASEAYSAAGYDMNLTLVPDDNEAEVYRDLRSKGSVDGIVVHGPRMADSRIALLQELGMPFVVHGRASDVSLPYSWVDVQNIQAFEDGAEFLLNAGHRLIALINGPEVLDFAHRRRLGFENALQRHGVALNPTYMFAADMTEAYGFDAARQLLSAPRPPTAFLVASIITALGVQRAIKAAGLEIGRDVSVVTFDDELSYLRNGAPGAAIFTALQSSVRDAGRRVAAMLLDRINNPDAPFESHMMDMRFVEGGSTGPAPL